MLTNGNLAELLWRAADEEQAHRERALRRAARAAFLWREEAAAVRAEGRSLTELRGVGPWIARTIDGWLREGREPEDPPRIRRGFITMAEALRVLEEHPEWAAVRTDDQVHTEWSDGNASIRTMAEAAAALGREAIVLTDHSKGLPIAKGRDEEAFAAQAQEVARVRAELERDGIPIRVLHGIEMNLSPAGEGDMDPEALGGLDLVLGAFHSKLRVKEDQTERYLAAVRNPTVDVLAHPRGRRYGVPRGLDADWPRVFEEAAATGVALECDAYPDRQDLEVELLRLAGEKGCPISVGTDAHATWELEVLEIGLAACALAGLTPDRLVPLTPAG